LVAKDDQLNQLGFTPQPMVRWLGPRGLCVTALQVMLSGIFGAYSDKREIQAALSERDGALTIYPVGVRRVPRKWRLVGDRGPHEPFFEPIDRLLATHLIEAPIRIQP
jgi:hypothetical protein